MGTVDLPLSTKEISQSKISRFSDDVLERCLVKSCLQELVCTVFFKYLYVQNDLEPLEILWYIRRPFVDPLWYYYRGSGGLNGDVLWSDRELGN